jgi:hypothetical protein
MVSKIGFAHESRDEIGKHDEPLEKFLANIQAILRLGIDSSW